MIARWPSVIPAGFVDSTFVSLMDFYPTFLALAGATVPKDRYIDGKSLLNILESPNDAKSVHRILYFYCEHTLAAVRYSHYKIYFYDIALPSEEKVWSFCKGDFPIFNYMEDTCENIEEFDPPKIFNVDTDPHELYPLIIEDHHKILTQVKELIEEHKKTLTGIPEPLLVNKDRTGRVTPCCNYPFCVC